jgi:hypothetical protein
MTTMEGSDAEKWSFCMQPGDSLSSSPRNPFRPLNWRWHRAQFTAHGAIRGQRGIDDHWVGRARRYLETVAERPKKRSIRGLRCVVHQALQLRTEDSSERRQELEARILAAQDNATIAARCRISADVVAAYAALFFDVRPLLANSDTVLFRAIGPGLYDPDQRDLPMARRLAAYCGGSEVVDFLFPGIDENHTGPDLATTLLFQHWVMTWRGVPELRELQRWQRLRGHIERQIAREPAQEIPVRGTAPRADLHMIRALVAIPVTDPAAASLLASTAAG